MADSPMLSAESATLWVEALAYREVHGDDWPDEALAHLNTLSGRRDSAGMARWLKVIDVLSEYDQAVIRH